MEHAAAALLFKRRAGTFSWAGFYQEPSFLKGGLALAHWHDFTSPPP